MAQIGLIHVQSPLVICTNRRVFWRDIALVVFLTKFISVYKLLKLDSRFYFVVSFEFKTAHLMQLNSTQQTLFTMYSAHNRFYESE